MLVVDVLVGLWLLATELFGIFSPSSRMCVVGVKLFEAVLKRFSKCHSSGIRAR